MSIDDAIVTFLITIIDSLIGAGVGGYITFQVVKWQLGEESKPIVGERTDKKNSTIH